MLNDYEIARQFKIRPVSEIAAKLGVEADDLMPFGHGFGKVNLKALTRERKRPGKPRLILVSATTPTSAGEGKTTTSIGLAQALDSLGESVLASRAGPPAEVIARLFRPIVSTCILRVIFTR